MILTTHILGAAALTQPIVSTHPALLFLAAIASHYLLDAIPHRDYELASFMREGEGSRATVLGIARKKLPHDLMKVAIDGVIGASVLFFIMGPTLTIHALLTFVAIVFGAVLPDALQLAFWLFPKSPLIYLQRFHTWVHTPHEPRPAIGFTIQGIVMIVSLFALFL